MSDSRPMPSWASNVKAERARISRELGCPNNCGNYLQFADDDLCSWCQDERDAEQAGEPSPWGRD